MGCKDGGSNQGIICSIILSVAPAKTSTWTCVQQTHGGTFSLFSLWYFLTIQHYLHFHQQAAVSSVLGKSLCLYQPWASLEAKLSAPRASCAAVLHSSPTRGVNKLLVGSDVFSTPLFLFPAHKKLWTVNLHSDQSMGHVPISLPSPSHLSWGWSAPASLIVHSPWAISCFWSSLFPFPDPFPAVWDHFWCGRATHRIQDADESQIYRAVSRGSSALFPVPSSIYNIWPPFYPLV